MDDLLGALKRQRALIQQHLDWLDAEIARLSQQAPPPQDRPTRSKPHSSYRDHTASEEPEPNLAELQIPKHRKSRAT